MYRTAGMNTWRTTCRYVSSGIGRTKSVRPLSTTSSGFETMGVVGLGLMGHGICQVVSALLVSCEDDFTSTYQNGYKYVYVCCFFF